jgi:hypothetical protein
MVLSEQIDAYELISLDFKPHGRPRIHSSLNQSPFYSLGM